MTESVPLIDAATVEHLTPMPRLIAALRAAFASVVISRRPDTQKT